MHELVITGASGFVAKHVIDRLTQLDYNITPVSRRRFENVIQVKNYKDTPPGDTLIHLAENPDRREVNRLGKCYVEQSCEIMKSLTDKFNGRVIYASSAAIYGDKNIFPYSIRAPIHVTDIYSESKVVNEKIVLDAGGTVLRLSNVYGIGMSPNNVMCDIIRQLEHNYIVLNDTSAIRDFVSVTDVASLIGKLLKSEYRGIVNVGSGVPITIGELAKVFIKLNNQKNNKVISREKTSKLSVNVLDIAETQTHFDWAPSLDFENNLKILLMANIK